MDNRIVKSAVGTLRNVGFQLPLSLGPLNGLNIPGRSLETAIYLAIGVRGWWKTEQTSNSLLGVIKMQNADNRLLSSSRFEQSSFEAIEAEYPFHGTTVMDEENGARGLQSIPLPIPFTTVDEASRAFLCIRALTSGLLCLFSHADVYEVLFNIL